MSRSSGLLWSLPALCALTLAVPPPAAGQSEEVEVALDLKQARDGIYTAEQARRGEGVYETQCLDCHSPREFSGPAFLRRWSNLPIGSLFRHIQTTMPDTNPGLLTSEQTADVVAYVLRLNGFPSGEEELPPEADILSRIRMDQPVGPSH